MKPSLTTWGPLTVLAVLVTVIIAASGAAVTIFRPDLLPYSAYLSDLKDFGLALVAATGVGRGLHLGLAQLAPDPDLTPDPESPTTASIGVTDPSAIAPDEGDAGKP